MEFLLLFKTFYQTLKGLYLLSAKFHELQTLSVIKKESKLALERYRTHEVLQVLYKNDLKKSCFYYAKLGPLGVVGSNLKLS